MIVPVYQAEISPPVSRHCPHSSNYQLTFSMPEGYFPAGLNL